MHPPPEKWTQYGTLSIVAKSLIEPGQCPIEIIGNSVPDLKAALGEVNHWLRGTASKRLATVFGEIDFVTASASEKPQERSARIEIMAKRLCGYPEDLIRSELKNYRGVYFPKLDEIRLPLERSRAYQRRLLVKRALEIALKRALNGGEEERPPISDEQRAIVSDGFARLRRELRRA